MIIVHLILIMRASEPSIEEWVLIVFAHFACFVAAFQITGRADCSGDRCRGHSSTPWWTRSQLKRQCRQYHKNRRGTRLWRWKKSYLRKWLHKVWYCRLEPDPALGGWTAGPSPQTRSRGRGFWKITTLCKSRINIPGTELYCAGLERRSGKRVTMSICRPIRVYLHSI